MKTVTESKYTPVKRVPLNASRSDIVRTEAFHNAGSAPLVIRPSIDLVSLSLWASQSRELIDELLLRHRALLFRGFTVKSVSEFSEVVNATSNGQLLEYKDRSSPRHEVSEKIYTSTDYPADQRINFHNEGTYWLSWPLKIYFFCQTVPGHGGETPIADCRRVYHRISPEIREAFAAKNIMYVRNYNDGYGLSWQTVFQTTDKSAVEKHCLENAIEVEWKEEDRLRTRQVRKAIAVHPRTGEKSWFNHAAFFHITAMPSPIREELLREFSEEDLPFNTYYGNGAPIEPSALDEIRAAYREETVMFPWQEGDVLMLDNMSMAHGREPFSGPRKILAAMAEPFGEKAQPFNPRSE